MRDNRKRSSSFNFLVHYFLLFISFLAFVIQTTEGRKNLESIHVYVHEILRFALNDNLEWQSIYTFFQTIFPIRNFNPIHVLYFRFIKHRIVRTLCLGRVFRSMKRLHATSSDTRQTMDSLGKIIPRTNPFVAEMIDTRHYTLTDGRKDSTSQITSVCRRTYLIEDDTEGN